MIIVKGPLGQKSKEIDAVVATLIAREIEEFKDLDADAAIKQRIVQENEAIEFTSSGYEGWLIEAEAGPILYQLHRGIVGIVKRRTDEKIWEAHQLSNVANILAPDGPLRYTTDPIRRYTPVEKISFAKSSIHMNLGSAALALVGGSTMSYAESIKS